MLELIVAVIFMYLYAVVVLYLVTQFCHNCFRMQCLPFVWEQFYEFFVKDWSPLSY